ncbi:hypothetical protein UB31_37190 [Bradyrhizobium sp. LTSP849]|uniref:hypothetical protein n=1 Tax=unclassified Bradyrhizobium TaxID=2631580 RepID=UPI0005D22907|nr:MULTISPECIES: hypothetical protein [unclassified Bradyrhizobium]KJC36419.1 hypothetical protein UB31_37190 [Bradyrhizobium sp. LTSP849]KJC46896.1 hypothetical protein UP06_12370 [Bradyrhizobium sp. LTSP857]
MTEKPSTKEFGKRRPAPVSPTLGEPVKRSRHVALLVMGTIAVGTTAFTLMPRPNCYPPPPGAPVPGTSAPGAVAPVQTSTNCSSGSSGSGSSHWSSRSSFFSSDSSSHYSSGTSSDSGSGGVTRGGFGSFAHGFSGGG